MTWFLYPSWFMIHDRRCLKPWKLQHWIIQSSWFTYSEVLVLNEPAPGPSLFLSLVTAESFISWRFCPNLISAVQCFDTKEGILCDLPRIAALLQAALAKFKSISTFDTLLLKAICSWVTNGSAKIDEDPPSILIQATTGSAKKRSRQHGRRSQICCAKAVRCSQLRLVSTRAAMLKGKCWYGLTSLLCSCPSVATVYQKRCAWKSEGGLPGKPAIAEKHYQINFMNKYYQNKIVFCEASTNKLSRLVEWPT